MKRIRIPLLFVPLLVSFISIAPAGPFAPGNLVIYRVGDGILDLTNRGNAVFLDEYTTNGTFVQSIMLPTNAVGDSYPLIASGTATSEGLLTRSSDGRFLVLMGYGTTLGGAASLAGTASTAVPRVVGRVDYAGNLDTTTALTNFASANNPRSAASDNGANLWVGGAGTTVSAPGGVGFVTLGGDTSTVVSTNPVNNIRQVAIFGGQLYASTASGSTLRIGAVGSGLPTGGFVATTSLPGLPTSGLEPYSFALLNLTGGAEFDTLYVADDSAGRGIIKYSLVSGNWVSNGVIAAASARGLVAAAAISKTATNVYLYATTGGSAASGGGSLYAATDIAGYNAAPSVSSASVIATAAPKTAFRGVAFAPVAAAPPVVPPEILSLEFVGGDVKLTWTTTGGTTNLVEAASSSDGSLVSSNFAAISDPIVVAGSGSVVTNFTEISGATNLPARYYRIKVQQ